MDLLAYFSAVCAQVALDRSVAVLILLTDCEVPFLLKLQNFLQTPLQQGKLLSSQNADSLKPPGMGQTAQHVAADKLPVQNIVVAHREVLHEFVK